MTDLILTINVTTKQVNINGTTIILIILFQMKIKLSLLMN